MTPFRRRRSQEDFSDEIQAHLAHETERLIEQGMTPDAARARGARRPSATSSPRASASTNPAAGPGSSSSCRTSATRAAASASSPAFLATTVLTLAVGLALLTVAFTVFNAYVLRPFAVARPGQPLSNRLARRRVGRAGFRWQRLRGAPRARATCSTRLSPTDTRLVSFERPHAGRPRSSPTNYFEALAPRMQLGRGRSVRATATRAVAVLSDQAWARLSRAIRGVLGRDLDLDGRTPHDRRRRCGPSSPASTIAARPLDPDWPIATARVEITARSAAA